MRTIVLLLIGLTACGCVDTQESTTVHYMSCTVAKYKDAKYKNDVERCSVLSAVARIDVRVNRVMNEVAGFYDGKASNSVKYTDCAIIDARNWTCRSFQPATGGKAETKKITLEDGEWVVERGGDLRLCYPWFPLRWLMYLFGTDSFSGWSPWLLGCSNPTLT